MSTASAPASSRPTCSSRGLTPSASKQPSSAWKITPVAAEVTRSWFETARPYIEGFHVYGTKHGLSNGVPCMATNPPCLPWATSAPRMAAPSPMRLASTLPDYADRLPP